MRAKILSEVQALRELVLTQARQIQELRGAWNCWSVRTPSFALAWGKPAGTRTVLPAVTAIARRLRVLRCRSPKANLVADSRGTWARRPSAAWRSTRSSRSCRVYQREFTRKDVRSRGRAGRFLNSKQCACGSPSIASPRYVAEGRSTWVSLRPTFLPVCSMTPT